MIFKNKTPNIRVEFSSNISDKRTTADQLTKRWHATVSSFSFARLRNTCRNYERNIRSRIIHANPTKITSENYFVRRERIIFSFEMRRNVRQLFSALLFEQLIYRTVTTGLVLLVTILRYSKYSPAHAYANNLNSFPYYWGISIHFSKWRSLRLNTKIVFMHFNCFSFVQSIFHVFRALDARIRSIKCLYFYNETRNITVLYYRTIAIFRKYSRNVKTLNYEGAR